MKQTTKPRPSVPGYELTNTFLNVSQLKLRVQMLTKPTSPRSALLRYALVLPVVGLLLMCTQVEKDMDQVVKGKEKIDQSLKLTKVDGEIFSVVEDQPQFEGGEEKLFKYLGDNMRYPAAAERANVQGRVFVSFVVTKEGDIADVQILKGLGFGCDEEAIRVVSRMPNWTPGKQSGKPVNVRFNLPIMFELEEGSLKKSVGVVPSPPGPLVSQDKVPSNQTRILVSGRVIGRNQKPLPGASIVIVGSNTGTTTDMNGKFMIRAEPNARLEVSFSGFEPQVVKANQAVVIQM